MYSLEAIERKNLKFINLRKFLKLLILKLFVNVKT